VELFQTIAVWHERGMALREMDRRLSLDVKTVRRIVKKIESGYERPHYKRQGSAKTNDRRPETTGCHTGAAPRCGGRRWARLRLSSVPHHERQPRSGGAIWACHNSVAERN